MKALVLRSSRVVLTGLPAVSAPPAVLPAVSDALTGIGSHTTSVTLTDRPAPERWQAGVVEAADRLLEDHGPVDVVHALDLWSAAVALVARRRTGAPVVVRAQSAVAPPQSVAATLWRIVLAAADTVIAPTSQDADLLRRHGIPRSRLLTCPDVALAASRECDHAGPAVDGAAVEGSDRPSYLLGLSGAPQDEWVRRQLVRSLVIDRTLHLVIASPSDQDVRDRDRLRGLAERHGVDARIDLVGRVSAARVIELVDRSLAVVGTRCDPTSGLSAFVAMNRSRPVVAVRTAGTEEAVVDGVTGVLADREGHTLSDGLIAVAADRFHRLAWGVAGRDRIDARFGREAVAAALTHAHLSAA
ncbi:MAG: glycosyltransferase [Angustibacter sp.]